MCDRCKNFEDFHFNHLSLFANSRLMTEEMKRIMCSDNLLWKEDPLVYIKDPLEND